MWGFSRVKSFAQSGVHAATSVPHAVSGTAARGIPSVMRAPTPSFGLKDRIKIARGVSKYMAAADVAAGRRTAVSRNYRFLPPAKGRGFW
jgi:hypothetical protein